MRNKRKREIQNRKNFLPSIIWTLIFWLTLGFLVLFLSPEFFGAVILFFIVLFVALTFSFSLIFANTRRGIILSLGITLFAILRYFGIGNLLNGLLIAGVTLASEIYFWYSGVQK